jgi:hypothetical protein
MLLTKLSLYVNLTRKFHRAKLGSTPHEAKPDLVNQDKNNPEPFGTELMAEVLVEGPFFW